MGKRGGVQGVSGCPGSKITPELSTCQGPARVPWELLPRSRRDFQSHKGYPWLLDLQWGEIRDTSGGEILQIL